jgi:putative transposase
MRELATARPRFGYERLHILLTREGWRVGRNRVHRLYKLEGLQVRMRVRRRKRISLHRGPTPIATGDGQYWAMDFVHDQLANGRKFRVLTVIDKWHRQCVALLADFCLTGSVKLDFIRPGKPTENAFIESFNGRLPDECLNVHEFATLDEARAVLTAWRHDYNHHRPHGSLARLTPSEFAMKGQKTDPEAPKR